MPSRQRHWANLPPELLTSIGKRLPLDGRICYRAVCTSWRSALLPVSPCVILVNDGNPTKSCIAYSLPGKELFHLPVHLPSALSDHHIISASGAWLALARARTSFLLNILTGERIVLPTFPPGWQSQSIVIMAFYPNPKKDNHVVVTVGMYDKVAAYVKASDVSWTIVKATIAISDYFLDVVVHDGKFYCLTRSGGVQVLDLTGNMQPTKFEACFRDETLVLHEFTCGSFAIHSASIAFSNGRPYQIWTCLRHATTGPDVFYIVVLRYHDDESLPCWKPATDLQGYSMFLGMNSALSVRANIGVPELRENCVYYFGYMFDVGNGNFVQNLPPAATGLSYPQWRPICWY